LADFQEAASSAAVPAEHEVWLAYESDSVCTMVTAHVNGLPDSRGTSGTVRAFAVISCGSFMAGIPAEAKASLTTSLSDWCLAVQPGASLHVKPCQRCAST